MNKPPSLSGISSQVHHLCPRPGLATVRVDHLPLPLPSYMSSQVTLPLSQTWSGPLSCKMHTPPPPSNMSSQVTLPLSQTWSGPLSV